LSYSKFKVIYTDAEVKGLPAYIINTDKGLDICIADSVHCSFYHAKGSVSKKEFKIAVPLETFKEVVGALSTKAVFTVDESLLIITGQNIKVGIPLLQVGTSSIDRAEKHIQDSKAFMKGEAILDRKEFSDIYDSLSGVSVGNDSIKFDIHKKKMVCRLESSFGKASDSLKCKSTFKGKSLSISIPVVYIGDSLFSSSFADKVSLRVSKDIKYYMLFAKNDKLSVECVGPMWQTAAKEEE
jgi:DNA polymerase III sliding clamp (beta) subunit (PCNA family)